MLSQPRLAASGSQRADRAACESAELPAASSQPRAAARKPYNALMARLAWFSPMPPVATGVAACSADLVAALTLRRDHPIELRRDHQIERDHQIDVFVDEAVARVAPGTRSAHDFVWQHQQQPYDLTVYQVGNSSHHDYQWPYLFRYPGLTVLHDAHLHHARAAALLRTFRAGDYRTEFAWNHPGANADIAELAVAGFDNHLYYAWPMTRLVVRASRLVAVHSVALAARLRAEVPDARITAIRLGHGRPLSVEEATDAGSRARARYGIAPDAIVFGCYGGLSPDKRLPQVLTAFAATRAYVPAAHLLLAGAVPEHYDLRKDIERHGLIDSVTLTGYLATDEAFTESIAACDIALNLRWPTAREVSGPWLRCLAAGKPTLIVDLAHMADVPTLDPRSWQPNIVSSGVSRAGDEGHRSPAGPSAPCAVAIDILDEDHSLRLAMRRLGTDPRLRATLGRAARAYWEHEHSIDAMVADYRQLIVDAVGHPAAPVPLPAHLLDDGRGTVDRVLEPFGLPAPFASPVFEVSCDDSRER
jgi:glycosyltransferase involved in cell wall biosynthesis